MALLKIYGVIYKITNKINNKVYIGQTTRNFDERYCYNLEKNTHNEYLKNDINKYGINNFDIIKEFDIAFTKDELDVKEFTWISLYDSTNRDLGYNLMTGSGSYGTHVQETTKKISKRNRGKNSYWYGKPLPEEIKRKISAKQKGKNSHNARKIICITTGKTFECMIDASKYYKCSCSGISAACRGKSKSCGKLTDGTKLQWKYYNHI